MKKLLLSFFFLIIFSFGESVSAGIIFTPPKVPTSTPIIKVTRDKKIRTKKVSPLPESWFSGTIETGTIITPVFWPTLIQKGTAIELYADEASRIYIERISLASGATIHSFSDFVEYDSASGEPLYRKSNPKTKIDSLPNRPFSYINGQFFDPARKYTPLSFGLKIQNTVLTAGADNRDEAKNILAFSGNTARILPYSWENLKNTPADFAIVSLMLDESHYPNASVGRTYLCTEKPDVSGMSHTILAFVFLHATEGEANLILAKYGCTKSNTAKLDSSGSSLIGYGETIERGYSHKGSPDNRKIPHIIGFYDAVRG